MSVRLISITPDAEKTMGYCARVSNPKNQDNPNVAGLLSYCIKHGHWSVFEMANMTLEVETTRAIAAQILRHKSFSFQEHSQRYSEVSEYEKILPRRQDTTNRQNSIDDLSKDDLIWFQNAQEDIWQHSYNIYKLALKKGIAKESARFLLPLNTKTRMYINGSIRSWIHYINLRVANGTQKEHADIANQAKAIFIQQLPVVAKALGWIDESTQTI